MATTEILPDGLIELYAGEKANVEYVLFEIPI